MLNSMDPLYKGFCPLCGGDVYSSELEAYGSCRKCSTSSILPVYKNVVEEEFQEFSAFFTKATGGLEPWGAQRVWLKRLTSGENTVLIAPTGMGKTTLITVYALYAALKGKRVLYVVPTRTLLRQVYSRLLDASTRVGFDESMIIAYDSSSSRGRREEVLKRTSSGDYRILLVTNSFLSRRAGSLMVKPSVVIADDVDSIMRSGRSIERLLWILGYNEEVIGLAKRKFSLLWKLMVSSTFNNSDKHVELAREYIEVDSELERRLSEASRSQFIAASATGRMKGLMGRVLRELLRIDVSGVTVYGRDVTDSYALVEPGSLAETLVGLVRRLGAGGIIYIAPRHPFKSEILEELKRALEQLTAAGFRIGEATPGNILRLTRRELDLLVGSASYYGSSVRGIDAPEAIKYVVFAGSPVFTVKLDSLLASPNMTIRILLELSTSEGDSWARSKVTELRRLVYTLSPGELRLLRLALSGRIAEEALTVSEKLASRYLEVKRIYEETLSRIKSLLDEKKVWRVGSITLVSTGSEYTALIPDVMTYIQASGRTSRLHGTRMTHGISIILEYRDLENVVKGLEARMKWVSRELEFRDLGELDLEVEVEKARKTREDTRGAEGLRYKAILLVVESPTKAKTIARFFGRPVARRLGDVVVYEIPAKIGGEIVHFNIMSTRGHIFDLTTSSEGVYGVYIKAGRVSPVYETIKKCRVCGTQFTTGDSCPRCGSRVFSDSKSIVAALRKMASEVDEVYIATDPDVEGEKIAYDVYLAVKYYNKSVWRIELHEITVEELLKALQRRRAVNTRLVEAEVYRRVLDRLVGFKLSDELKSAYKLRNMGAGRVQTPTLGLIIDRFREHVKRRGKRVVFKLGEPLNTSYSILVDKGSELLSRFKEAKRLRLVRTSESEIVVSPKPPYTTDELLADAARLGFPTSLAMRIAQQLFEAGLITYHRTDSHYVSSTGIGVALKYLEDKGLKKLAKPSHWGSPGTHEAIRPVYPYDAEGLLKAVTEGVLNVVIPLTGLHLKLYDLIFKRFTGSQMKSFNAVKSTYSVYLDDVKLGELELIVDILEHGFNVLSGVKVVEALKGVDALEVDVVSVEVHDSSSIPLYSEGELVSVMKNLGLGRPSTYSKIIESLKRHGYVVSSRRKLKLVPTKKGMEAYSYIASRYPDLVSIEATRRLEESIDAIASGLVDASVLIHELTLRLGVLDVFTRGEVALSTSS